MLPSEIQRLLVDSGTVHLPDVPRSEMDQLLLEVARRVPRGTVIVLEVGHDDGCPCEGGSLPITSCTCASVELRINAVDPEALDATE